MKAVCELCFHRCVLEEGGTTGFCRARANRGGVITPLNYGKITSLALDPIEKKPLRRFYPGSLILSVGSFGCNMRCPFCQNHEISMSGPDELSVADISPEELARKAERLKSAGNIGLAYTYNEPLVGYEYVRDCAGLIRERGMLNVLVTNGVVEEKAWKELLPLIDAANIDMKAFTPEGYRRLGGDLESVKRSVAMAVGVSHIEITALIVPGMNDGEDEIRSTAKWIASLSRDVPLHLSRFFPRHRMKDCAPTPTGTVRRLADVAREYLKNVYTGNC